MPQHEMPFAGNADCDAFGALDEFTQGYVQAIFFTEVHGDNPEIQDATFADLAPEALEQIKADCAAFQKDNAGELQSAFAETDGDYEGARAGTDLWFTRNGHGAGYWDRELGKAGDALTQAAKGVGSRDLYKGDDGRLYLS